MIRKPSSWKEVDEDFVKCDARYPIFLADELGVGEDITACFAMEVPQYFRLLRRESTYIVNTEGYNYIRYIQRIA